MKKLFFALFMSFGLIAVNAQETKTALKKGSFAIEANTGTYMVGNTGFSLESRDGATNWSIGLEGDYFVTDGLAIKAGLGYTDLDGDFSAFSYKIGLKYYIINQIPVGLDFTGASYKNFDENPFYLGIQGGYAWFPASNVSIEPTLRYNISLNEDFDDKGVFQGLIGFVFHF